jgi:3-dehydroshikimate dehydratase
MPTLSAFADEVGPDPKLQMDTMDACGVRYIELRGDYGANVVKFSDAQRTELKRQFDGRGFGVSCIASPIGKIRMDQDYAPHFDDYKRAVDSAEFFGARYIRIFSFYPPEGRNVADFRGEVVERLAGLLEYVKGRPITLVLENESNLFGGVPEGCVYLHACLPSPQLVAAFDPANFVNMNIPDVYGTCWRPLRRSVRYFHIKDFKYGRGTAAVPAGEGDGCIPQILADAAADGYDGFLALEPHLGRAEHSTGVTPPEMFKVAADALRAICRKVGWSV